MVVPPGNPPPKPPLGRKAAQAVSAAWIFGVLVVDVDPPPKPNPPAPRPVGSVTPWSFRQLRYAANAVLAPPPPPLNLGLRLAHAVFACSNLVLSDGESVVRVVLPEGLPEGGEPPPGLKSPGENVTPWLFKQFA